MVFVWCWCSSGVCVVLELQSTLPLTFFPPGEQVSGGGVLVMFRGLEPQLEGDEPRILAATKEDMVTSGWDAL